MAPYEALYGRRCRSPLCWNDFREDGIVGPDMIQESREQVKVIQEKMKTAQDRQKSYADQRRRLVEFETGEKVFLRVSPMKGVMRFGKKGKLSPKYIGPYEIIERIGEVSYRLALPKELENVHDVFHVSQLGNYISDPLYKLQPESIKIDQNLTYEERPVGILDRSERILRNKSIKRVKVLWRSQKVEEATWEVEDDMRNKYPFLFEEGTQLSFGDETFLLGRGKS
ncbi:uncharacterized protein LOC133317529 [Gastrolobium bilobum]|uniref:uncharacterized protein LOC133317529 n=1 Tax=Gastrolobium bilobum TaxID=150636 RepID=UPI002AAF1A03|nr:uncharacterized protein LOC133317529 [Gastrolobium bilobum]